MCVPSLHYHSRQGKDCRVQPWAYFLCITWAAPGLSSVSHYTVYNSFLWLSSTPSVVQQSLLQRCVCLILPHFIHKQTNVDSPHSSTTPSHWHSSTTVTLTFFHNAATSTFFHWPKTHIPDTRTHKIVKSPVIACRRWRSGADSWRHDTTEQSSQSECWCKGAESSTLRRHRCVLWWHHHANAGAMEGA